MQENKALVSTPSNQTKTSSSDNDKNNVSSFDSVFLEKSAEVHRILTNHFTRNIETDEADAQYNNIIKGLPEKAAEYLSELRIGCFAIKEDFADYKNEFRDNHLELIKELRNVSPDDYVLQTLCDYYEGCVNIAYIGGCSDYYDCNPRSFFEDIITDPLALIVPYLKSAYSLEYRDNIFNMILTPQHNKDENIFKEYQYTMSTSIADHYNEIEELRKKNPKDYLLEIVCDFSQAALKLADIAFYYSKYLHLSDGTIAFLLEQGFNEAKYYVMSYYPDSNRFNGGQPRFFLPNRTVSIPVSNDCRNRLNNNDDSLPG